jgi:hypothetical protein
MGNQESVAQSVNKTVNESISNVLMSNSSTCGQNNTATQQFDLSNVTAGDGCSLDISSKQISVQTPNFTCLSDSSQSSALQSSFETTLKQKAEAAVSGLSGALSTSAKSLNWSDIENKITSNINIANTAACVQNNLASQSAAISAIASSCPSLCRNSNIDVANMNAEQISALDNLCKVKIGSVQDLTQAAVASCTSNNSAITDVTNTITNDMDQESKAKNTGANLFESLIALLGLPLFIGLILCCCCCCCAGGVGCFMVLTKQQSSSPPPYR